MSSSPIKASTSLTLDLPISDRVEVRSYSVDDALSSLFWIELSVVSDNAALDLEALVGHPAAFRMSHPTVSLGGISAERVWSGVIAEAHLVRSESTGLSTYHLTLAPELWLLTKRTNCRVFQQQTNLEVATDLLKEWGLEPIVECERVQKTRKTRVQYQESDFAFICRLLEASGVTYYFRLDGGKSQLVLADAPENGPERLMRLECVDSPVSGTEWATDVKSSRILSAGKFTIADHDQRLANKPLLGESTSGAHPIESKLEHYKYTPGAFKFGNGGSKDTPTADDRGRTRTDPIEARRIAAQSAAAAGQRSESFRFRTNALDLYVGSRVVLGSHAAMEKAGKVLLTRTVVSGTHDSHGEIMVSATRADRPYRPEGVTPTPTVQGVESAIVVGPNGEDIHCDEFGRVRVQFHWDRYGNMDEMSSCWVPVAQAWAGDGLGAINVPRIGQEVVVSFLAGNPEEPMIVGRIHTNLLRPPFALPMNKTQNGFRSASVPATGGYNELMFEDKAGKELVRARAEKDMATRVNNDKTLSVGRHRKMTVEHNDTEQVEGWQKNTVFGRMMSTVGADKLASIVGDFVSMTGGQRIFETVGDYVSNALSHRVSSEVGTTLTCGASTIHIGPDSIVIQSPKILLNPGEDVAESAVLTGSAPGPMEEA